MVPKIIGAKQEYHSGNIHLYQMDCMDLMSQLPDKWADLSCVDPPYGLPERSGHRAGKLQNRIIQKMHQQGWDIAPSESYFKQLFRISNNQIIWGGNYFNLPPTRGFIIWDKEQPFDNFSACEFAWSSFDRPSKIFKQPTTRTGESKIHPTQKSVKLYKWLLKNYAKPDFRIIDTHLGSGSSAIAAYDFGIQEFVGCEIDKKYYDAALKRFNIHKAQQKLF